MRQASIYAMESAFDRWISGKCKRPKTMQAVIYNQYGARGALAVPASGTREQVLATYAYYKDIHAEQTLGLVCREYYDWMMEQTK